MVKRGSKDEKDVVEGSELWWYDQYFLAGVSGYAGFFGRVDGFEGAVVEFADRLALRCLETHGARRDAVVNRGAAVSAAEEEVHHEGHEGHEEEGEEVVDS